MRIRGITLALPMLVLALAGTGCIFSPDNTDDGPKPPDTMPPPYTADQLMANFQTAYSNQDIDKYREVLDTHYQFILNPQDVPAGESDRFTYAEEMHVAANMFSGDAVVTPSGSQPGISSIRIDNLTRSGVWIDMGENDPDFPNTQRGLYEVQITFSKADQGTIVVKGQQEFFVSFTDTTVQGVPKQYYRLIGQRDLTTSGSS